MRTFLFILCLGFVHPICAQSIKGPAVSVPEPATTTGRGAPAAVTEIWIDDPYKPSNFVRFSKGNARTRQVESEAVYKADDAKYGDWTIVHMPNNPSADQWQISTPLELRAPNGGPVNYCVTVEVYCDGHYYKASCYSTCNAGECGTSFKDFKECRRWSFSY